MIEGNAAYRHTEYEALLDEEIMITYTYSVQYTYKGKVSSNDGNKPHHHVLAPSISLQYNRATILQSTNDDILIDSHCQSVYVALVMRHCISFAERVSLIFNIIFVFKKNYHSIVHCPERNHSQWVSKISNPLHLSHVL